MKISHRSIPKFQGGGTTFNLDDWINQNKSYYDWYTTIYPNAQKLMGNPLQQRNDDWNKEQLSSSHYTTDDLRRSAYNNYLYTGDYNARHSDLQHWADSLQDLNNISDQDLVNRYNTIAGRIRAAREAPQTYNTRGYTGTNRDFRSIFESRSKQGTNNPDYVIGYQENLDDIEGTSTWQRRMDRYQTKFEDDTEEGKKNRIFYIKRPNGTTVKVYKKDNGDIALFDGPQTPPIENPGSTVEEMPRNPLYTGPKMPDKIKTPEEENQTPIGNHQYGFDWSKVGEGFRKIFSDPNIWSLGRLGLNLAANEKIYGEQIQGIKPNLKQTYNTYRQVVGDEATKQAYYRRAAQGQTKAARPFTSDADRQMAYQMEAKRVGDELRTQGDLADNQEIRRTSDESNQHQWANTQRATEVANANIASINQASALKHNLLAQKHAANFSSIDNAIKEIQYRKLKQQEEEKTLNDQIFTLQQQYELQGEPRIIQAQKDFQAILDKHKNTDGTYDWYNDEVRQAQKAYNNVQLQVQIELFNKRKKYYQSGHNISFARKGTRITRKNSDNILYMSTRDVIEHFRKMTKLSSDAQNRKNPKIEKLTSHPKGSTRKYQQGGVAPFLVYTPITLGGETTTSSSVSTSNTNSEDKKEALDLVKDLFKELAGKGLQIDVNTLYRQFNNIFSRSKAFGEELSTEDIQLMYLQALTSVNNVVRSKDIYDKAKTIATNNGALNEIAVDVAGNYVVQDKEGLVKTTNKSLSEITEEGLVPVTNQHLLYLREYSPQLFGQNGDLFIQNIINNGMGINQIGAQIKSLAGSLGHTESKIEGLTEVQSQKVKAGVQLLEKTDGTPDGIYEVTTKNQNSLAQINAALEYIQSMLSPSQLAILRTHGDPKKLITNFLSSQTNIITEQTMTGLTGKAASGKSGDNESIKSNFLDQVQRDQIGIDREFSMITKDGNSKLYSLNAKYISQLPNVDTDMSIEEMLGKSKIGSIMDSRLGVTFGDQVIAPENFKDIMFDLGGGATIVTLPCKYENGHKVVNFAIKDEYDNAVNEVSKTIPIDYSNPTFVKALSEKLHEKGLDSLLSGDSIDPNMLGHFMVVSAYTTDKINFNTNSRYVEKVKNPNKSLEERIIKGLSTNKDKNDYEIDIDNKFGWFELTWDDIYRGSVFIPLNNDPISAQTGWGSGDNIKLNEARDLAEQYQNFQKSLKQKESSSSVL